MGFCTYACRFQILQRGLNARDVQTVKKVILPCGVLHNMIICNKEKAYENDNSTVYEEAEQSEYGTEALVRHVAGTYARKRRRTQIE